MATTTRDLGEKITVIAAAERTSGTACIDQNYAGIPEITAAATKRYPLNLDGVWEIPFITNSVKGDRVDIHLATLVLTRVAYGGAVVAGTRPLATVWAVPGDGETADTGQAPVTGKMWIKLLPQAIAITLEAIKIAVLQAGEAGKNQKDTVTLPAGVTGGTFTLKAEGEETGNIKFNATAAEVKAALVAKAKLTGNIEVTGEKGGPYTVEFIGGLKEKAVALTASGAGLLPA